MALADFFISHADLEPESALADWRWLLGEQPYRIHAVASIGNLFLVDRAGRVYLLEIEDGTFQVIAESVPLFERALDDRGNRIAWLQTFLVRELRKSGIGLEPGQCYASKVPYLFRSPADDGAAPIDEIEPCDLVAHLSILGQLHRQVRP